MIPKFREMAYTAGSGTYAGFAAGGHFQFESDGVWWPRAARGRGRSGPGLLLSFGKHIAGPVGHFQQEKIPYR